jgi:hypothetical protein
MPLLGGNTFHRNTVGPLDEDTQESVRAAQGGHVRAGVWSGLFPVCANPHCNAGRLRLWRSRETPVFEGGWCCSSACTSAVVQAALYRELDGPANAMETHRHRVPLGLTMLEQGWIKQQDLRDALAAQRAAGYGRVGEWLVRQQRTSEEMITRALGLQWGCPVLSLEAHDPEGLTPLLPRLFIDAFGALPLRIAAGRILYIGFEERLDPALALAVERITGLRTECGLVPQSGFRPAHTLMLKSQFPHVELVEAVSEPVLAATFAKAIERAHPVESRLVRIHDCLWLRMWLRPQIGPLPKADSIRDLIGSAMTH